MPTTGTRYGFDVTSALVTAARTHYVLNNETKGTGDPVPLPVIVFLRVADEVSLRPAPVADAVRDLFGLATAYRRRAARSKASA